MSPNTALFAPPTYHLLGKSSLTGSSSTRAATSTTKKKKAAATTATAIATAPSPHRARTSKTSSPTADPLPAECEALKQKILQVHPEKTTRFSLSAMKRVAIPPVDIPTNFTNAPTIVAGKRVLFTRTSWVRHKHELRFMRRIRENEELR